MGMATILTLTPEAVQTINEILARGKSVEIGVRKDKIIIWEVSSTTKYEVVAKG